MGNEKKPHHFLFLLIQLSAIPLYGADRSGFLLVGWLCVFRKPVIAQVSLELPVLPRLLPPTHSNPPDSGGLTACLNSIKHRLLTWSATGEKIIMEMEGTDSPCEPEGQTDERKKEETA